jgi:hypothetical protein
VRTRCQVIDERILFWWSGEDALREIRIAEKNSGTVGEWKSGSVEASAVAIGWRPDARVEIFHFAPDDRDLLEV